MVIPYLDSQLFAVCLKVHLGLEHLFIGETVLEVYVADITAVICEYFFRAVPLIFRSALQLVNETQHAYF